VHLPVRPSRHAPDRVRGAQRLAHGADDRAPPRLRVLLDPLWARRQQAVSLLAHAAHLPDRVEHDALGALRAHVDAQHHVAALCTQPHEIRSSPG